MQYIVVPGPDGTVQVIETAQRVSETVKVKVAKTSSQAIPVPDQVRMAAYKVIEMASAA